MSGCRNTLNAMAANKREPKVVVLGGGSWGTTVASICARRGPTLQWVRSAVTAQDINDNHRNSRYLGNDVVLSDTLRATTDFTEAANCADVVVMGVPSHGFRGVLVELSKELRPWVPVVSLVKGLEQGTNMRMSQIIEEVLPGHPAGILAGPNIAREVAEGYARPRGRATDRRARRGRHRLSQLPALRHRWDGAAAIRRPRTDDRTPPEAPGQQADRSV